MKTPDSYQGKTQPTDREELEHLRERVKALEAENDIMSFILDSIPEYISYVDADLIYRVCNRKYEVETGISCDTLIGKHVIEFIGEQTFKKIQFYLQRVFAGEQVTYDNRMDYRYLKKQDVKVQYTPHRSKDGNIIGFSTFVQNITAQKRAEDILRKQALHDPLTNLPNRVLFNEQLDKAFGRANRAKNRLGIMFIDIDGFKQVNDKHGHDVGDQVLRDIADHLMKHLRRNDTLARYGGDEFVLLVDDIQCLKQITSLANKMVKTISGMQALALQDIKIGASIGIALYPDHSNDPQDLLIRADKAMYEAKRRGKGGYFLYSESLSQTQKSK